MHCGSQRLNGGSYSTPSDTKSSNVVVQWEWATPISRLFEENTMPPEISDSNAKNVFVVFRILFDVVLDDCGQLEGYNTDVVKCFHSSIREGRIMQ